MATAQPSPCVIGKGGRLAADRLKPNRGSDQITDRQVRVVDYSTEFVYSETTRSIDELPLNIKNQQSESKCIKTKSGHAVLAVRTLDFQGTFQDICETNKDDWAADFRSRLEIVSDLPAAAADVVHRQMFNINIRTRKAIPVYFEQEHLKKSKTSSGRPKDADTGDA
ncbi:hypothetical protein DPMN_187898 [Dreissena polymorpha]|uniref:Uncharacterized protein n=1 Tax=Dreissena polymorpha TaxID=45954 RepID=A0A9D4IAT3_DREPO|nr:hypothetical protein DPMN_187898 [Dreissena polymorpha]